MNKSVVESTRKPKILAIGDAVAPTGFSTVLHALFDRLKSRYEIHHLGLTYLGDPHPHGWWIYPAIGGGDFYGVGRLEKLMKSIEPDLVFILNDIWVFPEYLEVLSSIGSDAPVVLYCPIDGGPMEPEALEKISGVDRLVLYTEFGKRQIDDAAAILRSEGRGEGLPAVEIIGHGVDHGVFYPLPAPDGDDIRARRAYAKSRLYPNPDARDQWVVLNANRNQERKRIDLTIKGFALFAQNKPPTVKLHLHMGLEDLGWNIVALANREGISSRLIVSTTESQIVSAPRDRLNLVYNACEVGLNTSMGEGWGLVHFEHGAVGGAQVVPRHSSLEELWKGAAQFVDPVLTVTHPHILTEGHIVSADGVAAALERLYEDPEYADALSRAAMALTREPRFQWKALAEQWDALFRDVLRDRPGLTV